MTARWQQIKEYVKTHGIIATEKEFGYAKGTLRTMLKRKDPKYHIIDKTPCKP